MRILLVLSLAVVCIAQPDMYDNHRILNYDWNYMPNIACNIINAVRSGSPGLLHVNGEFIGNPDEVIPLTRVARDWTDHNRARTCEFTPSIRDGSYCRRLVTGGDLQGRYRAPRPPAFGAQVIVGDPNAQVPVREIYRTTNPQPLFMSCDEYPFASTMHERDGRRYHVRLSCVPDIEQEYQKRLMGKFYGRALPNGCTGETFYVGIYNIPPELVTGNCYDFCTNYPRPNIGVGDASNKPYVQTADRENIVCFAGEGQ
jgi:hypothetical protein